MRNRKYSVESSLPGRGTLHWNHARQHSGSLCSGTCRAAGVAGKKALCHRKWGHSTQRSHWIYSFGAGINGDYGGVPHLWSIRPRWKWRPCRRGSLWRRTVECAISCPCNNCGAWKREIRTNYLSTDCRNGNTSGVFRIHPLRTGHDHSWGLSGRRLEHSHTRIRWNDPLHGKTWRNFPGSCI